MGFFDSSGGGKTTYTYTKEDPYEYWRSRGLMADYSAATSELLRGISEARDPESSALFRQGRRALTQGNAVANEQARQAMAGRGTAFSGQAASASRDILGGQNRALSDLLLGVRSQGYGLASQLGGLSVGALRKPIFNLASSTSGTVSKPSGWDIFGDVMSTLSSGFLGDVMGGGGGGGGGGGYSASASDLFDMLGDDFQFDF